jgi:hypothetical protein
MENTPSPLLTCGELERRALSEQYQSQARQAAQSIPSTCTMAKSLGAHVVGARITHARPVSTCRPNKPNLTNPPACTVGAELVVLSCVQDAPGSCGQ